MISLAACAWIGALGVLLLPFSIAAANALWIITLILLAFSDRKALAELREMAKRVARPAIRLALLLAWLAIALFWSPHPEWGLHLLLKHWTWSLAVLSFVLVRVLGWEAFWNAASAGLVLHLLACTGQWLEWWRLPSTVSSAQDPTGFLGHIGFGLVYAPWAAGMLVAGAREASTMGKVLCWGIAGWSLAMIYIALGRAGWIIAPVILAILLFRLARTLSSAGARLLAVVFGMAVTGGLLLGAVSWHPHRWDRVRASLPQTGVLPPSRQDLRLRLWRKAWHVIQKHPFFGAGFGAYQPMAKDANTFSPSRPHNIYLENWMHGGIPALVLLLGFVFSWIRWAWQHDWWRSPLWAWGGSYALAFAIHGLFNNTLEEYHASVWAALLIGACAAMDTGQRTPAQERARF